MNSSPFDVFLSYSRADQTMVERVAQALHAGGLRVFLDRWYLAAGRSWPEALEDTLASCRAVAILLGPDGLGPWQQREQYKALDRQTKEPAFPVIPVVLPGTKDPALGFLGLNTWVDLRSDFDRGLELLAKAVRGEPAGPTEQGRDPRAEVCPYRGLQPFREEDAPFFCGREAFTAMLLERIVTEDLIVVVGASGSGKSSVVRAGLVPALRRGEDQGRVWEVAVLRPGRDPFQAVAASLLPPDPGIDEFDRIALLRQRAEQLRTGEVPLPDVATRVLEKQPGTDRVLLVVDQAEELFTLTEDPAQRRRFMELLLNATRKAPLTIVLTLRGDFYGRALENRDLADHLDRAVVNLGPMTRKELARAIREPAAKVGLGFEDGLIERILTDVGDEPGKLPLMEFLLEGLWQRRTRGCLTHRAYDDLGGVPGAIAKRADDEFRRLTAEQQAAARRFLVLLVTPGEGREDTRAVAELPKGDLLIEDVVRHFADARLLVTDHDASGQHELVEVSHEALISSWTELRRWVDENREFLRTLRRIEEAKHLWSTEGRKPDRLLQKGRPLGEAEDLLAKRPEFVNKDLGAYIAASQGRARRAAKLRNLVTIAAVILASVAVGTAAFAFRAQQTANSRALAVLALSRLEDAPDLALALSIEANDISTTDEGRDSLRQALTVSRLSAILRHDGKVNTAVFSEDGRHVVTASDDSRARVWDPATGRLVAELAGHRMAVKCASFDHSGRFVVTASTDNTARVWDVATGDQLFVLQGHKGPVNWAEFRRDGRRIVTASEDGTVRVWDAETRLQVAEASVGGEVYRASYNTTGTRIVTAGFEEATLMDGELRGQTLAKGLVFAAAFSPQGEFVAIGRGDGLEGTAQVWSLDTLDREKATPIRLAGHKKFLHDLAFSPDGRLLAVASEPESTRVWNVTEQTFTSLHGHPFDVHSVRFNRNGTLVVTGGQDGTARIWNPSTGTQLAALSGHGDDVTTAEFSPGGDMIVTASSDGTARVWRVDLIASPIVNRPGHLAEFANTLTLSPENSEALIGYSDGTVRTWSTSRGILSRQLDACTEESKLVLEEPKSFVDSRNRHVFTACGKVVRKWDPASGQKLAEWTLPEGHILALSLTEHGILILAKPDKVDPRLFELRQKAEERAILRGQPPAIVGAFSADGSRVATGTMGGELALWSTETGVLMGVLAKHAERIKSVAFSADGARVVTTSWDRTARVWDVASRKALAMLEPHGSYVMSAKFSPDGRFVATGEQNGTMRVWEVPSGRLVTAVKPHHLPINDLAFTANDAEIATASNDGSATLFPCQACGTLPDLLEKARQHLPAGFDRHALEAYTH